jgi:carbonic anhydrase
MTRILDEVLAANAKYAESFGDKGNLPLPPSRHFAILTCMDARLDPAKYAGLAEGDAHVIRNAGVGQAMTQSGHWSSRTNSSAPASGL